MKRLRSTETLGSTSAINSDKTGTLTLNQMTAVELTIPGRRYTISGGGYSTEGTIKHVAGQPEVPLEQFLLPMALCGRGRQGRRADRRPDRGRARRARREGRPRRGRDAGSTYPRIAELPFDAGVQADGDVPPDARRGAAATSSAAFVKGAPDQLLARAGSRPDAGGPVDRPGRRRVQAALHGRERAARRAGPARAWRPAARTSTRTPSTRPPICSRCSTG